MSPHPVSPNQPYARNSGPDAVQPPFLEAPTYWELVRRRADATPAAPMLVDAAGRRMSFGQFFEAAERMAAGLHRLGIGAGTAVTWQLPTGLPAAVLIAALARLGAVQNPIIHLFREREVAAVLRQNRPAVYIVPDRFGDRDMAGMARSLAAGLERAPQVVVFGPELPDGDPASLPPPPDEDAVRWIFYTSGTTSDPKGACHADRALIHAGGALAESIDLSPADVGTVAFPMAHIGGPMYLAELLCSGASAVLLESFIPAQAVALFRRFGVTASGGSTAHYLAFLNEQRKQADTPLIPTLRVLSGGGAPKPPELYFEVRQELGATIAHSYGMTEIPLVACAPLGSTDEQFVHTDGVPVPVNEIRIVRQDGSIAPPGGEGEIRVRGPVVCKGYTDPALDRLAFDADGFFRTGDLGVLRADGRLSITGRLKDIIIRKGENISAKEVEDILYAHPKVAAVAVIGLPDRERGELACAVVEPAPDAGPLTFAEMAAHCAAAGLMRQKIPERLEILDRLPRNETFNKVLKHVLRDRFGKPTAEVPYNEKAREETT